MKISRETITKTIEENKELYDVLLKEKEKALYAFYPYWVVGMKHLIKLVDVIAHIGENVIEEKFLDFGEIVKIGLYFPASLELYKASVLMYITACVSELDSKYPYTMQLIAENEEIENLLQVCKNYIILKTENPSLIEVYPKTQQIQQKER